MIVNTRQCLMCGNRGMVWIDDEAGYERWKSRTVDIQDALPSLSADERELLMTGTHAHCWEKMWAGHYE